jgi:hypothetical protein
MSNWVRLGIVGAILLLGATGLLYLEKGGMKLVKDLALTGEMNQE